MIKQYVNVIKYEAILGLKSNLRYKMSFFSDFLIFSIIYISVIFFSSGEGLGSLYNVSDFDGKILMLIGILFWQISVIALGYSSSAISGSFSTGTLELRLQSKFSLIIMQLSRVLVNVLISCVTLAFLLISSLFLIDVTFEQFVKILLSFIIVIPSILGMYGIGLIFGGLTLKTKEIGQFIIILQGILLFISNSITPISSKIINIIPFPLGTDITRYIYIGNSVPLNSILTYLLVNALWLLIGVIFFNKMLKTERTKGHFDTY